MHRTISLEIEIPQGAAWVLEQLRDAGYEAYVVGGCVRDSLLHRMPDDWDITTSAKPEDTKRIFRRTVDTGIQHGTVTVMVDRTGYEVTTYRIDGEYADGRHPEHVTFTASLLEDLKRRDFTINAMAYSPAEGLVDEFDGIGDINRRVIRAVGDPVQRFTEDALRMMRAIRFSAQLDYRIDEDTREGIRLLAPNLQKVSAERIRVELEKLLLSEHPEELKEAYELGLLRQFLPELSECMECGQNNPHHCLSVGDHILCAVKAARRDKVLRLALLLHDIAKPLCRSVDADGAAHFRGHNQRGSAMTRSILRRLKAPGYLIEGVTGLVAIHDAPLPTADCEILRWLNRYGAEFLRRLCALKYADLDAHAHTPDVEKRRSDVQIFEQRMLQLAKSGCYTIRQLAVNGGDLMHAGMPAGPAVGETLNTLLQEVMDGHLPNEREALLHAVRTRAGGTR